MSLCGECTLSFTMVLSPFAIFIPDLSKHIYGTSLDPCCVHWKPRKISAKGSRIQKRVHYKEEKCWEQHI